MTARTLRTRFRPDPSTGLRRPVTPEPGCPASPAAMPHVFSALVPICAALKPTQRMVDATCCADGPAGGCCPPVWAFHGANDAIVPVKYSDDWAALLRAQPQGRDIRYSRYSWSPPPPEPFRSHTGHGSFEIAFREPKLYRWLREQRCAACHGPGGHAGVHAAIRASALHHNRSHHSLHHNRTHHWLHHNRTGNRAHLVRHHLNRTRHEHAAAARQRHAHSKQRERESARVVRTRQAAQRALESGRIENV